MSTVPELFAQRAFPGWRPRGLNYLLSPETWLDHNTPMDFLDVSGKSVPQIFSQKEIHACFRTRGITIPADKRWLIPRLLDADVACMSHALSALLCQSDHSASQFLPARIRKITDSCDVTFDHIGVEVFGKLEWYVELFNRAFASKGIDVVDVRIFPSVQVRKALAYDPDLADVRIARIFFAQGDSQVNLEVFEATQSWKYIALRQSSLYAHLVRPEQRAPSFSSLTEIIGDPIEPVGHLAFRVPEVTVVEEIQALLLKESQRSSEPAMRPYVDEVFYNPSDGSTNTKFVATARIPSGKTIDSQIIEILSYDA